MAGIGVPGIPGSFSVPGPVTADDLRATTLRLGGAANTATAGISLKSGTTAAQGIAFGTDVTLYRSAADVLKTDDALVSATWVYAHIGTSAETGIGALGPSSQSAIVFGNAADTNLYRSAADQLKTDDAFTAVGTIISNTSIFSQNANTEQVGIGALGPSSTAAIRIGSNGNELIYRPTGGGLLRSNTKLVSDVAMGIGTTTFTAATGLNLVSGTAAASGIAFGTDTNLYRSAADTLRTDDALIAGASITTGGYCSVGTSIDLGTYVAMSEMVADPSTPGVNSGRLYLKDDGAGKTQLCILFNTGAAIVLATQA